jgi:protocatechuate 3,4-dioxygenase beta subunit
VPLFVRYRPRARVVVPVVALLTLAAIGGAAVARRSEPDRLAADLPSLSPSPSVSASSSSETPSPSGTATAAPSASPLVVGPVPSALPTARVVKTTCKESASEYEQGVPNDGTITGVVTDEAGHPLKGVRLAGGGECGMTDAVTGVNLTGADGRFAVPCVTRWKMSGQWWGLPPGWRYDGTSTGPYGFGYVGDSWGGVRCGSAHDVVLRAPATVHVQLVDSHGDPVARDVYFAMNAGFSEGDDGWSTAIGTDKATGRLTFAGLAPGPYYLYSSNGGIPGDKSTEVRGGFSMTAGQSLTVRLLVPNATTPSPTASATPVS